MEKYGIENMGDYGRRSNSNEVLFSPQKIVVHTQDVSKRDFDTSWKPREKE